MKRTGKLRPTPAPAALALALLLAGGCGPEPEPAPERPARRPAEPACDQARAELDRQSRGGNFLYEDSGEAMIDQARWIRMSEDRREALIGPLATLAACRTPQPVREVEITIRSETGAVIAQRRVRPSTDFRAPPR